MNNLEKSIINELQKIKKENSLKKENPQEYFLLQDKVMKFVNYKMKTKEEVFRKFKNEKIEIIEEIIELLEEEKIIDDEKYARLFFEEAIKFKCNSIKEIEFKLRAKGIDDIYIEDAKYMIKDELDEMEKRNIFKIFNLKQKEERKKVISYLYRKGYDSENIESILGE